MVKVINRSYSQEFLRRHHFEGIIAFVPLSTPPVAITLLGFAACLCVFLLILLGARREDPLFSLLCAIATYVYMVADHLDGMQARRARSGSYRGAILDHLCDFFNGSFIMLGAFWTTGASVHALVVMSTCYILAFSITHLEAVVRSEFRLGEMGPLEGLLIILCFFATMSIGVTRTIWEIKIPVLDGWPFYWTVFVFFLYKFVAVIGSTADRIQHQIDFRYIVFACLIAILALGQLAATSSANAAIAIWTATVAYAGSYILELLVAKPGGTPTPGVVAPLAITTGVILVSYLDLPLDFLILLSTACTSVMVVDLIIRSWRLPCQKTDDIVTMAEGDNA
jgi:phosphatidylglycerophosphate synthase